MKPETKIMNQHLEALQLAEELGNDIHVPLSWEERFAWKKRTALEKPSEPFQEAKDAQHYDDAEETSFTVRPGQFAVFFPEDAHAGCIGEGVIRKLVIKVKAA